MPGLPEFKVMDYVVADDDGEVDFTTAFYRAFDAAKEAGGGIVRMPRRTIELRGTLSGDKTVIIDTEPGGGGE